MNDNTQDWQQLVETATPCRWFDVLCQISSVEEANDIRCEAFEFAAKFACFPEDKFVALINLTNYPIQPKDGLNGPCRNESGLIDVHVTAFKELALDRHRAMRRGVR